MADVTRNSGVQVAPRFEPITSEYLDYNEVMEKYEQMMRWLAKVYVNALKIIHYMHDKYAYEAFEMGLHDGDVERIRATGIAGLLSLPTRWLPSVTRK